MLKPVNYQNTKAALSVISGHPVKRRSAILQAVAKTAGYDSFEQASALNNRIEMIGESVWVEQCSATGLIRLMAGNWTLILEWTPDNFLSVSDVNGSPVRLIPVANKYKNLHKQRIQLDDFTYKNGKLLMDCGLAKLAIERQTKDGCEYLALKPVGDYWHTHPLATSNVFLFEVDQDLFEANRDGWFNLSLQLPRIIWEADAMVGYAENEIRSLFDSSDLVEYEKRGLDVYQVIQTGIYLESGRRGYNEEYMPERPEKLLTRSMAAVAYPMLKRAMQTSLHDLVDSMSLCDAELRELLAMAKHEFEWFLATH